MYLYILLRGYISTEKSFEKEIRHGVRSFPIKMTTKKLLIQFNHIRNVCNYTKKKTRKTRLTF